MHVPKRQEMQSINPKDYAHRIIVAGSRHYNDLAEFHKVVTMYLERFDKPVIFISGKAKTGADDLIIRWCKKFGYPCAEYPADWDTGKGAGYVRNALMGSIATHLLAFYDGQSRGTKHMIEEGMKRNLAVKIIMIKIRENNDNAKQTS